MSGSTSGPSKRRRAPPNPYSLADHYESLALFLAARNLPVPSILKSPPQPQVRRAKGLAVVGTGLTDKNFCMKNWLHENPNGSKDAFEKYFRALPADVKKGYKDRANAAKLARKKKKTDSPSTLPCAPGVPEVAHNSQGPDAKKPGTHHNDVLNISGKTEQESQVA